jgi:hypothetical protein
MNPKPGVTPNQRVPTVGTKAKASANGAALISAMVTTLVLLRIKETYRMMELK